MSPLIIIDPQKPSQAHTERTSVCDVLSTEGGGKFTVYVFNKNIVLLITNSAIEVNFLCFHHERCQSI